MYEFIKLRRRLRWLKNPSLVRKYAMIIAEGVEYS